jgi:hypothetical protein
VSALTGTLPSLVNNFGKCIRDGFHSVPDFSFEDGDAVERVPTYAFLGPMQQPAAVALTLLTSAATPKEAKSVFENHQTVFTRKIVV